MCFSLQRLIPCQPNLLTLSVLCPGLQPVGLCEHCLQEWRKARGKAKRREHNQGSGAYSAIRSAYLEWLALLFLSLNHPFPKAFAPLWCLDGSSPCFQFCQLSHGMWFPKEKLNPPALMLGCLYTCG